MNTGEGNPLAEVGLALSMAFFSLMILMLVAVINSPKPSKNLNINNQSEEIPHEKVQFYAYYLGNLYDENLNQVKFEEITSETKNIVGLTPDLEIGEALNLRTNFNEKNLEITVLNEAWITRLKQIKKVYP